MPFATRAELPPFVEPELATLVSSPPEGDEWLHELKLDGYRLLCRAARSERGVDVHLFTRRGNDWTDRFPGIAAAVARLDLSLLLDGEAVVLDAAGRSDFQALQGSLGKPRKNLFLYAFDLLQLGGVDLTGAPLVERKALLRDVLEGTVLRYSDHVVGRGPAFFRECCRLGAEGIVSKKVTSPYRSGRTRDWLKVKCHLRQEMVIVGYTEPSGTRRGIGALLVGAHDRTGLRYCGRVGTGFTAKTLVALERRLAPLERKTAPVIDPPRGAGARGVHWVEPQLVAEVRFTGFTEAGVLRHPSYLGLREDKRAEEVTIERVISHNSIGPSAEDL